MAGNGLNASPIVKRPHRLKMSHQQIHNYIGACTTNVVYVRNDDFTILKWLSITCVVIGIILIDELAVILFRITTVVLLGIYVGVC